MTIVKAYKIYCLDRRNDYYFPRMTSRRRLTAMKRNPRNLGTCFELYIRITIQIM